MISQDAQILANEQLKGGYFQIELLAPEIARATAPGQFVHLQVPGLRHRVLRRPFSIFDVDPEAGAVRIVYKVVGEGTAQLASLPAGVVANLLGPLGRGFSMPAATAWPVIVAGGYGSAATYLLARRSPAPCLCLLGGRSAGDLLLIEAYRALPGRVELATDDGSCGHRGFVTDLLEAALKTAPRPPAVYACGPGPMLAAVSRVVTRFDLDAEVSLDHAMCCGVGACFACVVKVKAGTPDGWEYVRTCREGPVFRASQTVWD